MNKKLRKNAIDASLKRLVSRRELIKTCRMAYRYVLDQSAGLNSQTRLMQEDERELGRRLALIWMQTDVSANTVLGHPTPEAKPGK